MEAPFKPYNEKVTIINKFVERSSTVNEVTIAEILQGLKSIFC
jgi:hypothetical protein